MDLIALLVYLIIAILIFGLLWYALNLALGAVGLGQPWAGLAQAIFVLILVLVVVSFLRTGTGFHLALPRG